MRVLLINFTGQQSNPGCQATSNGLIGLLRNSGTTFIDTLPLGFAIESMTSPLSKREARYRSSDLPNHWINMAERSFDQFLMRVKRIGIRFRNHLHWQCQPPWTQSMLPTELFVQDLEKDCWLKAIDEIIKQEPGGMERIRLADRVIVNGEGTLHHNQRNALAALALARIADVLGKEVHVVNATIQAMHPEVLRLVLGNAQRVIVREPRSQKYLQSLDIPCSMGADCAFAATYSQARSSPLLPEGIDPNRACLVSGGCGLKSSSVLAIVEVLRSAGYSPFYFWIGDGDALNPQLCQSVGLPMVSEEMVPWDTLPDYLKQVRLVVSGRHHMLIFSLLARIPFIPLASNTWKIEGLCELFGWPTPVLFGVRGFSSVMSSLPGLQSEIKNAFDLVDKTGFKLAMKNVHENHL